MHAETKYIPYIVHTKLEKKLKIVDLGRQKGESGWKPNGAEGTQSGVEHSASLLNKCQQSGTAPSCMRLE